MEFIGKLIIQFQMTQKGNVFREGVNKRYTVCYLNCTITCRKALEIIYLSGKLFYQFYMPVQGTSR